MNIENGPEQIKKTFGESLLNSGNVETREAVDEIINLNPNITSKFLNEAKTSEQQEKVTEFVEEYKLAQKHEEKKEIRNKMEKFLDELWELNH